jgi:hypothetical protein
MTIPLNVNGVTYNYPETGNTLWGKAATDWAQAITSNTLQKSGGSFIVSSDIDFGPTGGLKAAFFSGRSGLAATTGLFRAENNVFAAWRNAANTGNLTLGVDSSDNFVFSSVTTPNTLVLTSAGNLTALGTVSASSFTGAGTGLTGIPNSATTATTASTPNTIVLRDGSGAASVIASSATVLQTGRVLSVSGDATGSSPAFNGSAAVSIPVTLATVNLTPPTAAFVRITANGKGLITSTSAVTPTDITTALGYTPLGPGAGPSTANLNMGGYKVINMAAPSADTDAATKLYVDNQVVGANSGLTVVFDSTGTTTVANGQLRACLYSAGATTCTLPVSPTAGMIVGVGNYTGRTDLKVIRNGAFIMALDQDLTIDSYATVTLKYIDAANGWVII